MTGRPSGRSADTDTLAGATRGRLVCRGAECVPIPSVQNPVQARERRVVRHPLEGAEDGRSTRGDLFRTISGFSCIADRILQDWSDQQAQRRCFPQFSDKEIQRLVTPERARQHARSMQSPRGVGPRRTPQRALAVAGQAMDCRRGSPPRVAPVHRAVQPRRESAQRCRIGKLRALAVLVRIDGSLGHPRNGSHLVTLLRLDVACVWPLRDARAYEVLQRAREALRRGCIKGLAVILGRASRLRNTLHFCHAEQCRLLVQGATPAGPSFALRTSQEVC